MVINTEVRQSEGRIKENSLILLLLLISLIFGVVFTACSRSAPKTVSDNGKVLYAVNCAICHGPTGDGDGPVGETMIPKASKLNDTTVASRADSFIFNAIKSGIVWEGKQTMPPAKDLSDEEISTLVRYLRTLRAKN